MNSRSAEQIQFQFENTRIERKKINKFLPSHIFPVKPNK